MNFSKIEFHRSADQKDACFRLKDSNTSNLLSPESKDIIIPLIQQLRKQFPKCLDRLKYNYPGNQFKQVRRYIKCNGDEFDHILDVDENGFLHPEFVTCPLRGECIDEGVICLPEQIQQLTKTEKTVLQHFAQGLTDKETASVLFKSPDTIASHRQNMLRKFGLRSKAALTAHAMKFNLL